MRVNFDCMLSCMSNIYALLSCILCTSWKGVLCEQLSRYSSKTNALTGILIKSALMIFIRDGMLSNHTDAIADWLGIDRWIILQQPLSLSSGNNKYISVKGTHNCKFSLVFTAPILSHKNWWCFWLSQNSTPKATHSQLYFDLVLGAWRRWSEFDSIVA